jgi:multisubunit Na+/H+ antiporter MnhC subunit
MMRSLILKKVARGILPVDHPLRAVPAPARAQPPGRRLHRGAGDRVGHRAAGAGVRHGVHAAPAHAAAAAGGVGGAGDRHRRGGVAGGGGQAVPDARPRLPVRWAGRRCTSPRPCSSTSGSTWWWSARRRSPVRLRGGDAMIGLSAIVVGVLFASAVYLMLSRNVQRVAIGFILLSNAVNLLVLAASGMPGARVPPLWATGERRRPGGPAAAGVHPHGHRDRAGDGVVPPGAGRAHAPGDRERRAAGRGAAMSANLVAAAVVVPLLTAVALMPLTGRARVQRGIALASGALLVALAGWLLYRDRRWARSWCSRWGLGPTVGIVWVVDPLAAVMLALSAITSLAMLATRRPGLRAPRVAVLLSAAPVHAGRGHGVVRHGRPLQPVRLLRDHAAGLVRPDLAGRAAAAAERRRSRTCCSTWSPARSSWGAWAPCTARRGR